MNSSLSAKSTVSADSVRASTLQGMFYPEDATGLASLLASFFEDSNASAMSPAGILVPHAGYVYSGRTAALAYSRIDPAFAGTFVVIGTGHQGYPTATADFAWETPLGNVEADTAFVAALAATMPKSNEILRRQENSIEVQMPFIRYRFPQAKVAPVMIGDQSPFGASYVAKSVIAAARQCGYRIGRDFIVVASGDGSHYVPAKKAKADDLPVLEAVATLDTTAFYQRLAERRPTMCGYGCIAAMAEIAKAFGATGASLIAYTTSGDATGDMREVVGYAAMEVR
ncbi:MAG TPA: AmmeMemoRadiSam system protein B [Methanocorpusculum sp.]|nr:AmmeMemoRadiSam system protein B [Methanocorpusculum sp.]